MDMTTRVDTSTPVLVYQAVPNVFAHGHVGIERSLGRLGVQVFGVHDDAWAPAARSRYTSGVFLARYGCSEAAGQVEHLVELAGRIGRRSVLVPIDDVASLLVQDHAAALREHFLFAEQPPGLAHTLSRKKDLYFLCTELNIPTPESLFPRSRQEVREFSQDATFPVVVKSIDSRVLRERPQAKSVVIARTAGELLELYDRMEEPDAPNLMLQEHIPGGPGSICMFDGYFNAASECLIGITGRKLRQHPAYTGITTLGVCIDNADVIDMTRRLFKAIGYRGIVDMGYRFDARDGQYKLLDVNPRIGATFRLFVDSNGMDVARAMYLDLTGQAVPCAQPVPGRKWIVETLDFASSATYFRDGRLSPLQWASSFRGVAEGAWFAREDPLPLAVAVWRLAARRAQRMLHRNTRR
jgi:D-aspartate ligase